MKACAPGKLVLSGAYSVLEGAPALVIAVDRYAMAEVGRAPSWVSEEVAEAIRQGLLSQAPWVDATALRVPVGEGSRKLGLGSSAAILVASIGADRLARGEDEDGLGRRVLAVALDVHRAAQGGGSGIDVAAACLGGVLRCQLGIPGAAVGGEPRLGTAEPGEGSSGGALETASHPLPGGLSIEAYRCPAAAATAPMVAAVARLAAEQGPTYRALMADLGRSARQAAGADAPGALVAALAGQIDGLVALGQAAEVPIVTDAMARLDALARQDGACFAPSGAGGGDVALWVGSQPSSARFRAEAEHLGLALLPLGLGARGVHRAAL
ncbi:MAG: hypothetical protein JRI68_12250 [Deltaproteobacteria bacterium]|nr:hypothetical protein [Deltaproteobacteria bacterium]